MLPLPIIIYHRDVSSRFAMIIEEFNLNGSQDFAQECALADPIRQGALNVRLENGAESAALSPPLGKGAADANVSSRRIKGNVRAFKMEDQ